jgi:hypothetical protein
MKHSEQRKVGRSRRHAMRLRETAEAAPTGGSLRARLLDLALQYDRMAVAAQHDYGAQPGGA